MNVTISSYCVEDYEDLIKSINSVCADTPWMSTKHFSPTPPWTHALIKSSCNNHQLLVIKKKSIIGWCRLFPDNCSTDSVNGELGIGLLREYRGKGLGELLVERSLIWARKKHWQAVTLSVSKQNKVAYHLFRRKGFTSFVTAGDTLQMICYLTN